MDVSSITPAIITEFQDRGFISVPRLISDEAVRELRDAYDRILRREVEAAGDRQLGDVTRQVMRPHEAHEAFRANEARQTAEAIAEEIFDGEPAFLYDMLIYKPPGHLVETPWHQDFAYAGQPTMEAGTPSPEISLAQFWIALDPVDEENGCMHFVPAVHTQPLLAHHVASGRPDDDSRLLAIDAASQALPLETAVACPLDAGGATIHAYNTPHYTPPNRSLDRPRRAYIFTYARRGDRRSRSAA